MESEETPEADLPKEVDEISISKNFEVIKEDGAKIKLAKKPSKSTIIKNSSSLISLYITSCEKDLPPNVTVSHLKEVIPNLDEESFVETKYGLIVNLPNDTYVQRIFQLDLAKIFGKPVQVVPLFSGQYKKIITFKDVPWCIRIKELENCLNRQGIAFGKLSREKSAIFVEVSDFLNYRRLCEEGINFYDSVIFQAAEDSGLNDEIHYNSDNIIQCYRCQGFWHTANTCKQNMRCVRCGEEHQVENCNRPKHNPICCNCKGPHHAAYKLCPIRLKLKKSIRVSFSFNQ